MLLLSWSTSRYFLEPHVLIIDLVQVQQIVFTPIDIEVISILLLYTHSLMLFFGGGWELKLVILRSYCWLCTEELLLVMFERPYRIPKIELRYAGCKASSLPSVLSLQPREFLISALMLLDSSSVYFWEGIFFLSFRYMTPLFKLLELFCFSFKGLL